MACNIRLALFNIFVFALILTIWRQIFDFLGYMWGPILMNFFQIVFTIFGVFGTWQYKTGYLIIYMSWTVIWCGWNIFVFCFYLNIGALDTNSELLSLWTGGVSWWEANGPGCKALFLPNQTSIESTEPWKPLRPDLVSGCFLHFQYVESVQAVLHFFLSISSLLLTFALYKNINAEKKVVYAVPAKTALYSSEIIPRRANEKPSGGDVSEDLRGAKPMTPRRVKRRSISRGHPPPYAHAHHSSVGASSASGSQRYSDFERTSSRRHSRTRKHHNPLNRIIQQQEGALARGHTNLMFQHSPENSFDDDRPASARSSYSNYHGTRAHSYRQSFLSGGPPGYTSQSETAI